MDAPPLYHGTRRGFRGPGGLVLPRAMTGARPTTAPLANGQVPTDGTPGSADWVYVTPVLRLAWVYAFHAQGRGRPRVLTVIPDDSLHLDPEHREQEGVAYRCCAAHVVAVDLTPPFTEEEARAGWILAET